MNGEAVSALLRGARWEESEGRYQARAEREGKYRANLAGEFFLEVVYRNSGDAALCQASYALSGSFPRARAGWPELGFLGMGGPLTDNRVSFPLREDPGNSNSPLVPYLLANVELQLNCN